MRKEIRLEQPEEYKGLNVPRLMHALIWGKVTKENAEFLEKTRMEELDELEEAKAESDYKEPLENCSQCSGTGIEHISIGGDETVKEICSCCERV